MAEILAPASPVTVAQAPRGVHLRQIRDLGKIDLRGAPSDRAFMSAVGRALDLLLPTEACSSLRQGELGALWLGPDQWLLTCPLVEVSNVMAKLSDGLGSVHAAITDVSAGRVVFRLSGPNARDVLAKGCPLDFHPSVVKPGFVAGSILAKITALIHLSDDSIIELYVGRSFADYLWAWLENAGLEYGVTVE